MANGPEQVWCPFCKAMTQVRYSWQGYDGTVTEPPVGTPGYCDWCDHRLEGQEWKAEWTMS